MYKKITTGIAGCSCMAMRNDAAETIPAGEVCSTAKCGINGLQNTQTLAIIMFPIQEYTSGFCPNEAFAHGTMFPELVL